jgi:hypothetical protein
MTTRVTRIFQTLRALALRMGFCHDRCVDSAQRKAPPLRGGASDLMRYPVTRDSRCWFPPDWPRGVSPAGCGAAVTPSGWAAAGGLFGFPTRPAGPLHRGRAAFNLIPAEVGAIHSSSV